MSQLSELNKGLVFSTKLDEWGQGRDEVSGVMPTKTDVYNVQDRQGNGGTRRIEYNGTSDYTSFSAIAAFGTSDFFVTAKIKTGAFGAVRTIVGGAANAFDLNISATGYLTAKIMGGSALTASTTLLVTATEYTLAYMRSGTTGTYYVNGVAAGTCTDSNNYSVGCTLVGNGTGYFNGSIFMVRAFNFAGTGTQIANYSKPEYPIEWVDRGATGTVLTSGTIVIGKKYLIKTYVASDVFMNVGAASNATGVIFIATGTTPTTWTSSSQLVALGDVLDLNAEGMASATWVDKTNSLTATNSGTNYVCPPASNLGAMSFNGSTSAVITPFNNIPIGGVDRTISVWVFPLLFKTLSCIISYGPAGGGSCYLITNLGGYFSIGNWNTDGTYSTTALPLNRWSNIVCTYSNSLVKYYLNGLYISSSTITLNTSAGYDYTASLMEYGNVYLFNGLISNKQYWNRILDQDQITLLYQLGH